MIKIHKVDLAGFLVLAIFMYMGIGVVIYERAYTDALEDHKPDHIEQLDSALWKGREENYQSITHFLYETEIGKCIVEAREMEKYRER